MIFILLQYIDPPLSFLSLSSVGRHRQRSLCSGTRHIIPKPILSPAFMKLTMSHRVPLPRVLFWYIPRSFLSTFSFLLTVLIQARWALSSDVCLQEVGSSTGIRYFKDHEEYLTLLETGLRRRKKTILNIFREWDGRIFPGTDSSLAGTEPSKESNADLKLLMQSIEDDADEDDISL